MIQNCLFYLLLFHRVSILSIVSDISSYNYIEKVIICEMYKSMNAVQYTTYKCTELNPDHIYNFEIKSKVFLI